MRGWYAFREWARGIFFRRREEAALKEEIEFHLEMETRKLVAEGLRDTEARRQASLRFGGAERTKEQVRDERGSRLLEESWADVVFGMRLLRRAPTFALGAIVALSLGIGASTAAYSLVDGVLLRPLPWTSPEQLYELRELGDDGRVFYPSYPNFTDWRERSSSFSSVVSVQPFQRVPVQAGEVPSRASVLGVSQGFFETLGVAPYRGRTFHPEENALGGGDVLMVSFEFWRTVLGAPESLDGVTVDVFGGPYLVVGVVPADHTFVRTADLYFPHEKWPGTVRSAHAYQVFGRLANGMDETRAQTEMNAVASAIQAEYPGESQANGVRMTPLVDELLGDQRRPLGLLLGAAALVLLVVSVNVGSTLLARGSDRMRELSVRSSLGASRSRLVRQLLGEALALAAIGGVLGIGLAWLFVEGALALAPEVLPRIGAVQVDLRVLFFAMTVTLGTTLLFGLLPALRLSSTEPGRGAGLRSRGGSRSTRGWGVLLAAETALAVVLLIGAGLMVRSVSQIVSAPPNWSDEGVLEIRYAFPGGFFSSAEEGIAFTRELLEELGAIPSVASVGLTNHTPLGAGNYTAPAKDPTREENPENYTGFRVVNRDYFGSLRIALEQGRLMEEGEADAAVINRALAERLWPGEDPIGRTVTNNFDARDQPFRVVGVVADAGDWRFSQNDQTEMYVPWYSRPEHLHTTTLLVQGRTADLKAVIPAVRERLATASNRIAWEVRPMASTLASTAADRSFVSAILATFALVGGVIALVGILGVVGYTVSRRRRELGIRMALGAQSVGVRVDILRSLTFAIVPGVVVGLLSAMVLSRAIESLLHDVSRLDAGVYWASLQSFFYRLSLQAMSLLGGG